MPGLEGSGQEWGLAPCCLEVRSPSRTAGALLCLFNFWRKSSKQPKAQPGTEQGNGPRARGAPAAHHCPVRPGSQATGDSAPGGLRMGPARRAQGSQRRRPTPATAVESSGSPAGAGAARLPTGGDGRSLRKGLASSCAFQKRCTGEPGGFGVEGRAARGEDHPGYGARDRRAG